MESVTAGVIVITTLILGMLNAAFLFKTFSITKNPIDKLGLILSCILALIMCYFLGRAGYVSDAMQISGSAVAPFYGTEWYFLIAIGFMALAFQIFLIHKYSLTHHKHKKLPYRLSNLTSWLRHPSFVISYIVINVIIGLAFGLTFPCGRNSSLNHGICTGNVHPISPLSILVIILAIAIVVVLPALLRQPNDVTWDTSTLLKGMIGKYANLPKWYKRQFPWILLTIYTILVIANYFLNMLDGPHWYNYIAQYGIFLPFCAAYMSKGVIVAFHR